MHTTVCTTVRVPVRHGMAWHGAYRVPEPCREHTEAKPCKGMARTAWHAMAGGRGQGPGGRGQGGRACPTRDRTKQRSNQARQTKRGKKVERKTLREAAGGTVLDVRDKDQEAQPVRGVMVSIGAFQALVPGSIPGGRIRTYVLSFLDARARGGRMSIRRIRIYYSKRKSQAAGFEPARAEPIRFQV